MKYLTKLQSIQRTALIAVTKCYRTVSTDVLCVLSGCLPLHLLIEKEIVYASTIKNLNIGLAYNLNNKIKVNYIKEKLNYFIKENKE